MTARELLQTVRDARVRWDTLVDGVAEPSWLVPGLAGAWTLRDVVAHISWFEREMELLVRTRRFEGSELWLLPCDDRNDAIYRENLHRSVDDVRTESATLRERLLEQLASLRDEELEDPACFPPMPGDWRPIDILAQNTYEHYAAHAAGLQRRLDLEEAT